MYEDEEKTMPHLPFIIPSDVVKTAFGYEKSIASGQRKKGTYSAKSIQFHLASARCLYEIQLEVLGKTYRPNTPVPTGSRLCAPSERKERITNVELAIKELNMALSKSEKAKST